MSNQYVVQCRQCRKKIKDPKGSPIYVSQIDMYFCDEKCWDKYRKKEPNSGR